MSREVDKRGHFEEHPLQQEVNTACFTCSCAAHTRSKSIQFRFQRTVSPTCGRKANVSKLGFARWHWQCMPT